MNDVDVLNEHKDLFFDFMGHDDKARSFMRVFDGDTPEVIVVTYWSSIARTMKSRTFDRQQFEQFIANYPLYKFVSGQD